MSRSIIVLTTALSHRGHNLSHRAHKMMRADRPARNDWIDRGVPQATPGPNTF
jgi:hypothetical protein